MRKPRDFLRWLEKAPLSSLDLFIASFAEAPDVGTHVLLRSEHLGDYSADVLARLPALDAGIVSLMNARQLRVAAEEAVTESAEQWIDLLERTQMSHGFLACRRPLTVFLLNLPATTASAAAEKRLRVMRHLNGVAIYRVGHTSDTAPWSKRRSLEAILVSSFT